MKGKPVTLAVYPLHVIILMCSDVANWRKALNNEFLVCVLSEYQLKWRGWLYIPAYQSFLSGKVSGEEERRGEERRGEEGREGKENRSMFYRPRIYKRDFAGLKPELKGSLDRITPSQINWKLYTGTCEERNREKKVLNFSIKYTKEQCTQMTIKLLTRIFMYEGGGWYERKKLVKKQKSINTYSISPS